MVKPNALQKPSFKVSLLICVRDYIEQYYEVSRDLMILGKPYPRESVTAHSILHGPYRIMFQSQLGTGAPYTKRRLGMNWD